MCMTIKTRNDVSVSRVTGVSDASLPYLTFGVSDKSRLLDAEIHRHEDAERAVDIKLGARGS